MAKTKNKTTTNSNIIDITEDENIESNKLDQQISMCDKCKMMEATHFCKDCKHNLCKLCIIDHYKNSDFKKDHEMLPL